MTTTDETILDSQGTSQEVSGIGQSSQGNGGGTGQAVQQDDTSFSSPSQISQPMDFDLGMGDSISQESASSLDGAMDFSQETDSAQEVLSPVSTDDFSLNFDDSVFASSPENKELDAVKDETPSSSLDFSLDLGSFSDTEPLVQESELPIAESEFPIAEPELSVTEPEFPIAEPELPIAEPELPVTESELPITESEFPIAEPELPVTESEFPIAEPELPVTESELPVAEQKLPIAESELSIAEPFLSPSMDDESSHGIEENDTLEFPSTGDANDASPIISDGENSSTFFKSSEPLGEENIFPSGEGESASLSHPSSLSEDKNIFSSFEESAVPSSGQLSGDDLVSDTLTPAVSLNEEENISSGDSSNDSLSSFPGEGEKSLSESSYQPTEDAFGQTISALQNAKDEGNSFLSSEELPTVETSSQHSENSDSMLNLDQMVAKFHGEEIPQEENPFEPMKKALEAEEKKALLEKGVNPDDGIPLVVSPEATSVSEEIPTSVVSESSAPEGVSVDEPPVPEETSVPVHQEQIPQEPIPEDTSNSDSAMFSLDDIIPEGPIPVPVGQEITTKLPILKNKSFSTLLVGGGIFVVLVLVITTMFPGVISSIFTSTPNTSNIDVVTGGDFNNVSTEVDEESHGSPSDSQSSENNSSDDDFSEDDIPDASIKDTQTSLAEVKDDESGIPFIDEPDEIPSLPTPVSSQEMISILTSLSNQGKQYLDLGESENEPFLVKFGGFIWYQAGLLINHLESGGSLSIDEYNYMVARMNDFLTNMQGYLDGSYDPNVSSQDSQFVDEELNKQELQDFIYGQNRF